MSSSKAMFSMSYGHIALAIFCPMIWGTDYIFANKALDHFPPYLILTFRFAFTAAALIPFYRKPPERLLAVFGMSTMFGVVYLGTWLLSMKMGLDATVMSILENFHMPITAMLSYIFLKEKIGFLTICGIVISALGIVVLSGTPNAINHMGAFLLMIGNTALWSVYNVSVGGLTKDLDSTKLLAWISLFAVPQTALVSYFFESGQFEAIKSAGTHEWISIVYLCIFTAMISHGVWCYLMSKNPVSKVTPFSLLIPVFGVSGAYLFLNEKIDIYVICGGIIITIGIAMCILKERNNGS